VDLKVKDLGAHAPPGPGFEPGRFLLSKGACYECNLTQHIAYGAALGLVGAAGDSLEQGRSRMHRAVKLAAVDPALLEWIDSDGSRRSG